VLFSNKVQKFNKYDWKQERNLVITDTSIHNCKGKRKASRLTTIEIQRSIPIKDLKGITKCMTLPQGGEFVIHVDKDYDYRFKSET